MGVEDETQEQVHSLAGTDCSMSVLQGEYCSVDFQRTAWSLVFRPFLPDVAGTLKRKQSDSKEVKKMSSSVFGWSYPPGCSGVPGDDVPQVCLDCELCDEVVGSCPYEGIEDYCFKLSLVKECAECKKKLCKVQGAFKPEQIACGYEQAFCCSKECRDKLQAKIDEELGEMYEGRKND